MFDNILSKSGGVEYADGSGVVKRQIYFPNGATALTPGCISYGANGPEFIAIADDALTLEMAIPDKTYVSGDVGYVFVRGPVPNVVTPSLSMADGDGFTVVGGAIADAAAAFTTNGSMFAVSIGATTTATLQNMLLIGGPILKST